jgi:peroxiredoxin
MLVIPFEPLWNSARGGTLQVGDPAPDFTLPLLSGGTPVTLSEEYPRHPVVLVFGSYT